MRALELKIPPALLMLLFMLMTWGVDRYLPQFKQEWIWSEWAYRTVFLLAVGLIGSGVMSFKNAQTTVNPTRPENASSVVTSGIYRWSRNPMYLGFLMILLAFVLKLSNPITLLVLPIFVLFMNRFQIRPEERALNRLFGEEYLAYCQKVRRWI